MFQAVLRSETSTPHIHATRPAQAKRRIGKLGCKVTHIAMTKNLGLGRFENILYILL